MAKEQRIHGRIITKPVFLVFLFIAALELLAQVLISSAFLEFYKLVPEFLRSDSIIWWFVLLSLVVIEILNLVFINNKRSLISESELEEYSGLEFNKDDFLILIPALNEEGSIEEAIKIAQSAGKVVVINDGSSDRTQEIAEVHSDFVIRHRVNQGLANSIVHGIDFGLKKNFKYFVIFDADCQYTKEDLLTSARIIHNSKYDIVMGSRLTGIIDKMPRLKKFGNSIFSKTLTYMTRLSISDGQTGLRAFTAALASTIHIRGDFTYTQEMLFEVAKHGFDLAEFPIHFKERLHGESRLMRGPIQYAIRAWILNLQIIAEYNPLKFALGLVSLILVFTFFSLGDNREISSNLVLSLSTLALIMLIGIYSSIIIKKLNLILNPSLYEEIK